jgi:adenylate cyclase
VVWATGSVRPVDLTVGGVSHIPEKLGHSMNRLKQEVAAGRQVMLAIPEQNAADVPAALRDELSALGIELFELARVDRLFDAMAVKPPEARPKMSATTAPMQQAKVSAIVRRRYVWASAVLLSVAGAVAYLMTRSLPIDEKAQSPPSPVIRSEARMLVPELVPFISDDDRARLRDVYMGAPDYKALAIGPVNVSFVTGQPDKATAEAAALNVCQQIADRQRDRVALPHVDCELYAVGNEVVSNRGYPPMPVPPWLVRDPTIESSFELSRVPLLTQRRRPFVKPFQDWRKPRALAMSATGRYGSATGKTTEEAIRRALEWCGHNSGVACILLAIDDVFVLPIPSLMKVVGLVQSGPLDVIAPELRDDVARRLHNSTSGWNAVAVGASGRAGLKLGAGSEQAAIDGALEACGNQDRECRVIVLGPFLVARLP